ncbi:acyltransferase [Geodermatophilus amargosae]|uniref:acyltransferase n=1 Tax=Geodermatophilus amargosae TaxID=1296565 RepID=UPI0034DEDE27
MAGVRTRTKNIHTGCFFGGPDIEIGAGAFVNRQCYFDVNAPIRIGEGAHVGPRVMFLTSEHDRDGRGVVPAVGARSVSVGRGAWIGAGACLLPGVTVGEGAVVAAGAVVREAVPPFEVWGGVPAKRLSRPPKDEGSAAAPRDRP